MIQRWIKDRGRKVSIQFFSKFRKASPDLEVAVDHMVADDDNVAIVVRGQINLANFFASRLNPLPFAPPPPCRAIA